MLIFKSLGKNVGDVLLDSWRRKVTGKSRCWVAFVIAYLFNAKIIRIFGFKQDIKLE